MPSKRKSKANSSNTLTSENATVQEDAAMESDEGAIRLTIRKAKEGSIDHTTKLSQIIHKINASQVAEAISIFCAILDQPALSSKHKSTTLSPSVRGSVISALIGISEIPESMLAIRKKPNSHHRSLLEKNWHIIFNSMLYFYREIYSPSSPPQDIEGMLKLTKLVAGPLPTIVTYAAMDDESFTRMIVRDDVALNILLRIWLLPDALLDLIPTYRHRFTLCHEALNRSFCALLHTYHLAWPRRMATVVHSIWREVKWDSGKKMEALFQYCRDPERAYERSIPCAMTSIGVLHCVVGGWSSDDADSISQFTEKVIRDGILPLILRWFSFVAESLQDSRTRQVISEVGHSIIHLICGLLLITLRTRNGLQWAIRFFDNGFLPAITRILSHTQCWSDKSKEFLAIIFSDILPKYFCDRFVVTSAIKAVKNIIASGDVTKFELSSFQESWKAFTNVLLERTVIYTACSREFGFWSGRRCVMCHKTEQEATLFKCARCKDAVYCSKHCQTISWKVGGHREECKILKESMTLVGARKPTDNFAYTVALAELRRHSPGVSQQLQSSDNPSGVPLCEAFISVCLQETPSIQVYSRRELPETHPYHISDSRPRINPNDRGSYFEVVSFVGGEKNEVTAIIKPMQRCFPWFSYAEKFDGDSKAELELLCRKPAQDFDQKKHAFCLDEVDHHVMDARKNFRPPFPGDEESPRTIYDYVEMKVAADPDVLAWMRCTCSESFGQTDHTPSSCGSTP